MVSYVINGSTASDNLEPYVTNFTAYLEHVAELWPNIWGTTLHLAGDPAAPTDAIPVYVIDTVSDEDALAYHTRDDQNRVSCVVERSMIVRYGLPMGPEVIHEVGESWWNPELNRTKPAAGLGDVMYELYDPVSYLGQINVNGTIFPNLTGPDYWGDGAGTRYDLAGLVKAPLPTIPSGGVLDVAGQLHYGDAIPLNRRQYLLRKHGRRWAKRMGV